MSTLLRRGFDICRSEGLNSLLRKGTRYGLNRALVSASTIQVVDDLCYSKSVERLYQRMEAESCLDDVLDTAFDYRGYGRYRSIKPLQIREEFGELVEAVAEREPTTIMEIGTANGGTFYTWCRHLDSASTILSLDLPGGDFGGGYSRKQTQFFDEFATDKELIFIRDDSHDERTARKVGQAIPKGGVDFLLIDGDHRYQGVKQDYEMYSPLVSDGGLIAFHDIVSGPNEYVGGVPKFWRELRTEFDVDEIIADEDNQNGYGVGLLHLE